MTNGYFPFVHLAETAFLFGNDPHESGVVDGFVAVELSHTEEEGRDEVVDDLVVEMLLVASRKTTVYRHTLTL